MNTRIIARLDIKSPNLVKGICLEGLRKMGDPHLFARQYFEAGIDEIIYMDIVASLYERNSLLDLVRATTQDVFVPVTVGGGIRSVQDVETLLCAGADRVAINTAALKNPNLIAEVANRFGAQCVVLSIEAKRKSTGGWEAYYDNGREHSYYDVVEWAKRGVSLGAGEILLTAVDHEGREKGFDDELMKVVSSAVTVPVIASGGMGTLSHFESVVKQGQVNGVAIASVLHYKKMTVADIRNYAKENDISVRTV